ncbi:hypothetical protein, partial [Microseira wollei]|uniref:hypothetical protein n=1 Tax=Microseira wollei TaxID=467598 RepID=UPI001CFF482F
MPCPYIPPNTCMGTASVIFPCGAKNIYAVPLHPTQHLYGHGISNISLWGQKYLCRAPTSHPTPVW